MRLNRYLAQSGVASRRAAEEVILAGRVSINGAICTELSRQVAPTDSVKVDGKLVRPAESIYVLLNKPADYLTTGLTIEPGPQFIICSRRTCINWRTSAVWIWIPRDF